MGASRPRLHPGGDAHADQFGEAAHRSRIRCRDAVLPFAATEFTPSSATIRKGYAMPVRIYHNPRCHTSRKTLALLREKGIEPEVVEYLKTPYSAAGLRALLGQLGMPARALLRKKEAAAA